MPKIKAVEKRIWDVEGFDVQFHQNGKDVRGDKQGVPQYGYERAAKNDMTVSEWRDTRFHNSYPGYQVEVLDGDGAFVHGGTKLGTVRDTYEE
ncbi:hypothetical protein ABU614_16315 [Lysobacter firmicutimachus]|uniref:HNH endonuclease n=1 Tax=Lysobacter firmicutimachus TaxID=1792846 RepID=A0AAU8MN69_9GAMM